MRQPRRQSRSSVGRPCRVSSRRLILPESIRVLVFDGDDTLWETQPLYDKAKMRFTKLISQLGLDEKQIRSQIDEIDSAQVAIHGFSRHRFPRSLGLALKSYEQSHEFKADIESRQKALRLGRAVFSSRAPLVHRARSSLRMLKKRFKLLLVTKGDPVVQRRRIRTSGLSRYFDSIYVVRDKTPDHLRRILKKEGAAAQEVAVVGNSLRSDIHPALKIGATAVWIPASGWSFEHAEPVHSQRFYRAKSLRRLAVLLMKPKRC
jgi:putative hydrolase of the HAD superfamily